jgi:transposase
MIGSGVVVYLSRQPVDFHKGAASLIALVRDGGLDRKRVGNPTYL